MVVRGELIGTGGTKNIAVRIGLDNLGSTGSIPATDIGPFVLEVNAVPSDVNVLSSHVRFERGGVQSLNSYTGLTANILTATGEDVGNDVQVTMEFASGSDSLTINSVEVYITG